MKKAPISPPRPRLQHCPNCNATLGARMTDEFVDTPAAENALSFCLGCGNLTVMRGGRWRFLTQGDKERLTNKQRDSLEAALDAAGKLGFQFK